MHRVHRAAPNFLSGSSIRVCVSASVDTNFSRLLVKTNATHPVGEVSTLLDPVKPTFQGLYQPRGRME
jgi:hypothetical protein